MFGPGCCTAWKASYLKRVFDKSVTAAVRRALIGGARAAFVVCLAFALFAPDVQELVSLQTQESCGQSCCRSGKSCSCCHRRGHSKTPPGRRWMSGRQCSKDCGQSAELPVPPIIGPDRPVALATPLASSIPLPARLAVGAWRSTVYTVLFQRPPPVLL